ncbi:Uncharacterised protein [Legionella gratiana]|uniref:Uncharacterized protein n=2 Tax=Legionella gratiana TaxID=45066 RepID=A0A378J148_9GAMM|nr:Uncharacterised protein [Legionella gratiana]
MHVIDEYCSNVPFVPVPQFTSRSKSSRTFYNWTTQQYEHWFDVASKLGSHFAIYKVQKQWAVGDDSAEQQEIAGDLVALKELFKIRTKAFNNLKSELEKMITVNNQPQVLRI